MKTHHQLAAILNMAAGAFYLLAAIAVLIFMGMTGVIVATHGEHQGAGILGIITVAIVCFLAVLGLPSVVGGWALLVGKSWAKPLLLVLSILHLPNIPFGTALGVYTLWVLLSEEQKSQPAPPALQPTA